MFLLAILITGCQAEPLEPVAGTEPEAPVVTTAAESTALPVVVATNTYLPVVEESDGTSTPNPTETSQPTATATIEPSPTPGTPVEAIQLIPIESGLQRPLYLTHAGDERLFVVEQVGRIRIIEDGQLLDRPFLDIRDRVGSVSNEQGLLGLAFHPDYAVDESTGFGHFWVNYTDYSGNTRISRFSVNLDDPNLADPSSEVVYLTQRQPYPNHNGGVLKFGPDGYLYAGLGDGGSANDPLRAGQDLSTFLGKILRLDVDSDADRYTIPGSNPFIDTAGALPEIWAYGLRNPWRLSFDRLTGDMYIADVGQNQWEEVNFQPGGSTGGENYGWSIQEGSHCFQQESCDTSNLIQPFFEYSHAEGCSITGGYIYRGQDFPALTGNYFVADYCQGKIWRLFPQGDRWQSAIVLDSDLVIPSFGEDVQGELYVMDFVSGGVFQIQP